MTHDQLCWLSEYAPNLPLRHMACHCDLIAMVREDMLSKCIAMVDDLASDDWYWPRRRLMGRLLALQEKP